MITQIVLVIVGLLMLLTSGELLVRGAVDLARALKVPALIVSLTIVAFGTSAPEIVVSIQAVLNGSSGIALGNIIGSNIANILMVLGIPAIIYPISSHVPGLRPHALTMIAATLIFAFFAYSNGAINFLFGAILFAALLCYLGFVLVDTLRGGGENPVLDQVEDYSDADSGLQALTIVFLIVGLIGLPLGAHILVTNGSEIASQIGIRDAIIGLTIVAFGTSLPELATVFSAALKKKSDVAIGSIVGSNIFNLLAVGGVTGLFGGAKFDAASLQFDLPVMIVASLVLVLFVVTQRNIGRLTGILMTAGYIAFIFWLASGSLT